MKFFLIRLKALLENKSIPLVIFESLEFNEGLKDWAINELKLAGLYDKDSDYEGMIGKAVEEIIEIFSKQGHSGGSAAMVISLLEKLLRYEPLTPCDHSDYVIHDETKTVNKKPIFQCSRCYDVFSEDNGKTWYSIKDKK